MIEWKLELEGNDTQCKGELGAESLNLALNEVGHDMQYTGCDYKTGAKLSSK